MNRQSLVAKMLHLQVASALVCILLYFALLFAMRITIRPEARTMHMR